MAADDQSVGAVAVLSRDPRGRTCNHRLQRAGGNRLSSPNQCIFKNPKAWLFRGSPRTCGSIAPGGPNASARSRAKSPTRVIRRTPLIARCTNASRTGDATVIGRPFPSDVETAA
jgi:hypothetical protein